ncbi:MAG TPA: type IV secretion system protein [Sediminibacterium sp.]|uniref:type IV secretion system protein n=1 Tax=Sediminibacterium sp. TaxID=1917865 RepID=UPI0006339F48|nr:type IV secretion system protein [Sediminibacterium sp.]KKP92251.1 MAG: hypothetical protein UR94_C0003G0005 [Parcubacteria group bacterium GW2011_GWA2_36_10]HLD52395.1 type IV secretion system protein [Sediminibacterium sp.]
MKLNKIFRSPRFRFGEAGQNNIWLGLITIMAVFLLVPNISLAFPDSLGEFAGGIIFYVLFSPFIALFELEMWILPSIAQFNNFTKLEGVVTGWTVLRDLSNMFFIVVLLVMAFGTILKMQSYGYKELLKTLIIMAILINFSKTIAGFLIDIGQVVMLTFVSAIKDVAAGNLTAMFGIDKMVQIGIDQSGNPKEITSNSGIVLAYLLGGIMMMLVTIVLMAFIVMLVMRIVFLWILVVLSPLAFLANTFPATKKYFSEWFGNLMKEIIVGPVLIFFLWLSLTILNGDVKSELTQAKSAEVQAQQGQESVIDADIGFTEAGKWDNVVMFIVALGMLIGSLKITQGMGSKAMAFGNKAADKMKSGINSLDKKFGVQKQAKNILVGSTGEGGLRGGAQRLVTAPLASMLMGAGKVLSPIGGGLIYRAGAGLKGAERKRKQTKLAEIEKQTTNLTAAEKEQFYTGRGGTFSKMALAKTEIEAGKLKDKKPAEAIAIANRARKFNDDATLTKVLNSHVIANTQEDFERARKAGKGVERFSKGSWGGTYTEDPDGVVHIEKDEQSAAYQSGITAAKEFVQLDKKEQDEIMKTLDAKDQQALKQYMATIKPEDLVRIDTKNEESIYRTERTEKVERVPVLKADGTEQTDGQGNVIYEKDGDKDKTITKVSYEPKPNEDSAEAKRAIFLARHDGGTKAAEVAYEALKAKISKESSDDIKERKEADAKQAADGSGSNKDQAPIEYKGFDDSSLAKAIAKNMEGGSLVKMGAMSKIFQDISKHLTQAQMQAMAQEGGGAHLQAAVDNKIAAALEQYTKAINPKTKDAAKEYQALSDIRKLLNNVLTKAFITDTKKQELMSLVNQKAVKNDNDESDDDGGRVSSDNL